MSRVARGSITITWADCGEMQAIPPLARGGAAACHRCDRLLERRTGTRYDLTLACRFDHRIE